MQGGRCCNPVLLAVFLGFHAVGMADCLRPYWVESKLLAQAGICNVSGKEANQAWSVLAGHACVTAGHHADQSPFCCGLLRRAALAMLQPEHELLSHDQEGNHIAGLGLYWSHLDHEHAGTGS